MVTMKMRAEHPSDRLALEVFGKDLFPPPLDILPVQPGIDDRPAVRVRKQPKIYMIECERKRHAQPKDALGNFFYVAGLGF